MSEGCKFAVVQFLDGSKVKKVVPVSLIRQDDDGATFSPMCMQDLPSDNLDVKWQKSDMDSDGYFPANVLCLGGSIEAAIATAKNLGHKISKESVMLEPVQPKLESTFSENKAERKSRAKRNIEEDLLHKVVSKKSKTSHSRKQESKSHSTESSKKKKIPVNRLATDPVIVSRLKASMSAAFKTNPIVFEHLQKKTNQDIDDPCVESSLPKSESNTLETELKSLDEQSKEVSMSTDIGQTKQVDFGMNHGKEQQVRKQGSYKEGVRCESEGDNENLENASKLNSPVKSKIIVSSPTSKPKFLSSKNRSQKRESKSHSTDSSHKKMITPSTTLATDLTLSPHLKAALPTTSLSPLVLELFQNKTNEPIDDLSMQGSLSDEDNVTLESKLVNYQTVNSEGNQEFWKGFDEEGECNSCDSEGKDDDLNSTLNVNSPIKSDNILKSGGKSKANSSSSNESTDELLSDDSSSEFSENGSSSDEDAVSKLSDEKKKLQMELSNMKAENKDLKTQLAVVWSDQKTKAASMKKTITKLETEIANLKTELQKEKTRISCLQNALVASKIPSVARQLKFDKSPAKVALKSCKVSSPAKSPGSPISSPWKVERLHMNHNAEESPEKVDVKTDNSPNKATNSSGKKKSGKKYIESNCSHIDMYCQKILGWLNKIKKPEPDNGGKVDVGNGLKLPYKPLLEILKSPKGGPVAMARNFALLTWGSSELASRSLDGKTSNRYPNAAKKVAATPAKVNCILVKCSGNFSHVFRC